jgi:hypothetical protein
MCATGVPRVGSEDADGAAISVSVALDDLDGRRLAGAVRPQQGDDLAGAHLERDTVDDGAAAIALRDVLDGDRRTAGGHARHVSGSCRSAARTRVGHRAADLPRPDDTERSMNQVTAVRRSRYARLDRLIGVDHGRPRRAVLGDELASWLGRVVRQDADDR